MSKAKKTKTPVVYVYCGPRIINVCPQWRVFTNGLTRELQELADNNPKIKALIVPLERMTEVRKALTAGNNKWAALYKSVKEDL